MADEKLNDRIVALEKELKDSKEKTEKLEKESKDFQVKIKGSEDKETEFSKEKTELESKLKETEEKAKELSEKQAKLEKENKEFAEKEAKAREEAKKVEIEAFVSEKVREGKLLPRIKEPVVALLSLDGEEKVCKYSIKEGDKEVNKEFSVSETIKEVISRLPNLIPFEETSKVYRKKGNTDTQSFDLAVKAKMDASQGKLNYAQASKIIASENPELFEKYQKEVSGPVVIQ